MSTSATTAPPGAGRATTARDVSFAPGSFVMRVGALAAAHPAVAELDLNPVIATSEGALVVDARVRLEAPGPVPAFPSLNT